MSPRDYDRKGRVFYKFDPGGLKHKIKEFISLPISVICDTYLMVNYFERKFGAGTDIAVRPFPSGKIIKVVSHPNSEVQVKELKKEGRLITEVKKRESKTIIVSLKDVENPSTFYFFKNPDKKAYELAGLFALELEKKVEAFRNEREPIEKQIQEIRHKNRMVNNYLSNLQNMNASEWVEHLKRIAEEDPRLYEDFMKKTLTPLQKEFIEELNKNPLTLKEFFKGTPTTESKVREIFNTFHYMFGFKILKCEERFPDYLLFRNGKEIKAEAELYASNFLQHHHNPKGCDMIVCWENNIFPEKIGLDVFEVGTGRIHKKDKTIEDIIVRP